MFAIARNLQIEFFRRRIKELPPSSDPEAGALIDREFREATALTLLRGIGRIVQSAFNALRGRATFRMRKMAQGAFDTLVTHREWYLLMVRIRLRRGGLLASRRGESGLAAACAERGLLDDLFIRWYWPKAELCFA